METRNFPREQVVSILMEAYNVVLEAEIPEPLRVVAFTKAIDLCSSKRIEQAMPILGQVGLPGNRRG